jgi:stage II sporulation protein D
MLPSAFFAIEKNGNAYNFYGGGYGHGVGLPQWSAYDLGKNHNYKYRDILKKYYSNISFKNMYSMKGVGKTIRIGISTTGFKSLDHNTGIFSSSEKFDLLINGKTHKIKPREKVEITNKNGNLVIKVNGKEIKTTKTAQVILNPSKGLIGIETIKRNTKRTPYPVYRGKMEIKLSATNGKIRVINEVNFEDYLLQVVPSEMGENFGLEALKAQAVAARTYALKDYFGNKYKSQGFHIDDSTKSQVYNNKDENETSTQAIRATKGEVMLYDDKPIDAKYYSTSAGFGAAAHNIW